MRAAARHLSDLQHKPDFGAWFDALTALMSGGNPPLEHWAEGETIMRSGDPADCFLVILEGAAEVQGTFGDIATLPVGPGALLGELGVLFEGRRRRTVVATAPTTAIVGSREELEQAQQVEAVGDHVASVAGRRLAEHVEPIPAATGKGLPLLLRPLLPGDRNAYLALFGQASLDTIHKRFFTTHPPPAAVIERLLYIDHVDHFAWVAIPPDYRDGPGLGIVRLVVDRDEAGAAEVAFAVHDNAQGQGVGTLLLGFAGAWAAARRLQTLTAHVLVDNAGAKALLNKANPSWAQEEAGMFDARMAVADAATLLDADITARVAVAARQLQAVACLADA